MSSLNHHRVFKSHILRGAGIFINVYPLKPGEQVEALPCGHVFHRTCVACSVHIAVEGSLLWQKVPGL